MMLAVSSRDPATVKVLLDAGYSPNASGQSPLSPLDLAQATGAGLEIPRLLLQYGADPNGNGPVSSLLSAVMKGDIPYVELLLEAGRTNRCGIYDIGPLSFALNLGKSEMVDFLIERNIGLDDPMLGIFLRTNSNSEYAEKIAVKRGTAWLLRVNARDVAGVRHALENGANLRAKDKDHESALTIAIRNLDAPMVRVLLEAGCELEADNDYDVTPLHRAARVGSPEITEILISNGAELEAVNKFGRTPLLDAAVNGHQEAADYLIAAGAIPGAAEAILLKRRDLAEALWQSGTPIDFAGDSGMTALHAAASLATRP
jgi:ankyrin repeat protein